MLNNKGYATLTTLLIVLIITSALLLLFYDPILDTSKNVAQSSLIGKEMINDKNGEERLYSLLVDNISYEEKTIYADLNNEYEIKTLNEEFETIELNFKSEMANGFSINNKTNITMDFNVQVINPNEPHYYDVKLVVKGKDILDGQGLDLKANSVITVNSDKIYDKLTGETNYGNYMLNITPARNCNVDVVVTYEQLRYRELEIKGDNFRNVVVIENPVNNPIIKFK